MAAGEGEKCLNGISSQTEWAHERVVRIHYRRKSLYTSIRDIFCSKHGGGRGIRTLAATFGHPTGLAIPPLQPLGYPTIVYSWIVWKVISGANFYSSSTEESSSPVSSSLFFITTSSSSPSSSNPISTIFSCSSFFTSRKCINARISFSDKSLPNKSA